MMPRLSARDEQLLSDYLDGQLSAKEAANFEERLSQDKNLREAAAGLRRLKVVLRSAPRYRVPRNFTLSPDMLKNFKRERQPEFGWRLPALRLSSAAAVLLLVAAFVLETIPGALTGLRAAPVPVTAPAAEKAAQSSPPPIILWNGQPAEGRGGGGPAAGADLPMEAPAAAQKQNNTLAGAPPAQDAQALTAPSEPLATPTIPDQQMFGLPSAPTQPGEPFAAPLAPQAAPDLAATPEALTVPGASVEAPPQASLIAPSEASGASAATPQAAAKAVEDSAPTILGIRPTDERAILVTPEGQAISPAIAAAPNTVQEENNTWLWIKLALALAALSTGTAAVLLQRRARK